MNADLFFVTSKLFWMIFNPLTLLSFCAVLGMLLLWTHYRYLAKYLITFSILSLMLAATLPLAELMLTPLENRFPKPKSLPENVSGIILLGGAFNLNLSEEMQYPILSQQGNRIITAMSLRKRYPQAHFLFSGHNGSLTHNKVNEADIAYQFFEQYGFAEHVQYEKQARNTYENALYTKILAQPQPKEHWILVTSAAHMPRSVGVFRKNGWEIIPFPAQSKSQSLKIEWPSWHRIFATNAAAKEWVSLMAYFITGKTDSLFPAP